MQQRYVPIRENSVIISRKRLSRQERLLGEYKEGCLTPKTASSVAPILVKCPSFKSSKPKMQTTSVEMLFQIFRYLVKAARYSEMAYQGCLLLLGRCQVQSPQLLAQDGKLVAVVLFFIYSKAYEHRKVSLKQVQYLANHRFTKDRIIEAESIVLRQLGFEVFLESLSEGMPTAQIEQTIKRSFQQTCLHS